jgi:hypothetical protein
MNIQQFDFSTNLLQAILWQYNEAEHLQALLNDKQLWYNDNQTQFWNDWYNNVFNLQTADEFGLKVWSIILGLPLYFNQDNNIKNVFGFNFLDNHVNFVRGNFIQGTGLGLTVEEERILLKLRYFKLVSRCAIPEINNFLRFVFNPMGIIAYMLDGLDMSITFVCGGNINQILLHWIKVFDLIPRGAGVLINYINSDLEYFGFNPNHLNFTRGQFIGKQ